MPRKGSSKLSAAAVPWVCGDRIGTEAGYSAHMRVPEQPCAACKRAHNAAMAAYQRRRRGRERMEGL